MTEPRLSDDRGALDLDRVHSWLASSYWSPDLPRATFERAVANSMVVGAYDPAGVQVGFARVITDRATFAWVADVWVDTPARGTGLGRAMVRYFRDHPELQGLRRWMLVTLDAHGVYAPLGFGPVDPDRLMQIYDGVAIP